MAHEQDNKKRIHNRHFPNLLESAQNNSLKLRRAMLTATKQWFTLPVLISCYCFVCTQANSGSVYYLYLPVLTLTYMQLTNHNSLIGSLACPIVHACCEHTEEMTFVKYKFFHAFMISNKTDRINTVSRLKVAIVNSQTH